MAEAEFAGDLCHGLIAFEPVKGELEAGLPEILSEDFEHGRHYGSVRAVDPFLVAANDIHELPAMYDTSDS